MYSVTSVEVVCTHSIAANLIGWSLAIARAALSPTANWIGAAMQATVSGISSPRRWIAVAPPAQHPDGVDRRDQEARDEVRGQDHVRHLVRDRRVEDHLQRLDRGHLARVGEKPCGWFIHEFTATTENAPPRPVITIGTPAQKCVHGASRFQPKM